MNNKSSDSQSGKDGQFLRETEELRALRALEEIERNPSVSQRELAGSLGVAVGIANSLIHTLVRKGLIKIKGENNRSITYHLTKKGIGHKASLAMEWTRNTVSFYGETKRWVGQGLSRLGAEGVSRVVLWGGTELTEIAAIVARDADMEIVGIVATDGTYMHEDLFGIPVGDASLLSATAPDAIMLCLYAPPDEVAAEAAKVHAAAPGVPVYYVDGESLATGG